MKEVLKLYPGIESGNEQDDHLQDLMRKLMEGLNRLKSSDSAHLGGSKKTDLNYSEMRNLSQMPETIGSSEAVLNEMLALAHHHPYPNGRHVANALPLPNIPSILGSMTMNLLNGNALWDVFSPAGAEAETKVISMMRKIVGDDYQNAWGYTTWGGQGAVLTSLRLAILKRFPTASKEGVPNNLYCFASELSHYSLYKSMEATGIGTNRLVKVRCKADHTMDTEDLKTKMNEVVKGGGVPLYVMATMGTTDHFAVDDIREIDNVVEEVCGQHGFPKSYIHADSAMGGMFTLLNGYDFEENPYGFEKHVVETLSIMQNQLEPIGLADSLCFDFHKFGQTPYTTSLFMLKQEDDLTLLDIDAYESPYIGDRGYGEYHTGYTLECSRSASSIPMYASLIGMGLEGYRRLFAQYIETTLLFREKVSEHPNIEIVNEESVGPITLFRVYPKGSNLSWDSEQSGRETVSNVEETNRLNERFFEALATEDGGFFLGDTKKVSLVETENERLPVYAAKFVASSPYTTKEVIPSLVAHIWKTADQVIQEHEKSKGEVTC